MDRSEMVFSSAYIRMAVSPGPRKEEQLIKLHNTLIYP